jgi:hypothetical protein
MTTEELIQQEKELMEYLSSNRQKQRELNQIAFMDKHKVYIGDCVEFMDGKTKRTGIISGVEFSGVNPSYYICTLFNTDGKLGKREVRIWHSSMNTLKVINYQNQ